MFNDNRSYLEKLNEEKSSVVASLAVNKKILTRFIIFVLCSLVYLIVAFVSKNSGSHDIQTQFINSFVNAIMIISFIISFVGIVLYVLVLCFDNFRKKLDNLKFKFKKILFVILDWVVIFPACATIASVCFAFIFTFAEVSGESMYPTVENRSTVFLSYLEEVERYDVVVAYITTEDSVVENLSLYQQSKYPEYYIKRVIGIPGDRITWINGILTINGKVIEEEYFDAATIQDHIDTWTEETGFNGEFAYKKDGITYVSTVIPEGYYFVMGDHRDVSIDSRKIGLIPEKNIEGVVKFEITNSGIERVE